MNLKVLQYNNSKIEGKSRTLKEKGILLLLFFILITTTLSKLYFSSSFEADEARDILVARHIVQYKEYMPIGHNVGGTFGLFYSKNYYNFLSFLDILKDNPYFIFFCVGILHIVAGILLFFSIDGLINRWIALSMLLIYSISPQIIISSNVWGAYLAFVFNIIAFFFYSLYLKKSDKFNIFLILHFFFFSYACTMSTTGLLFVAFYSTLSYAYKRTPFFLSILQYAIFYSVVNIDQFIYFKLDYFSILRENSLQFNFQTIAQEANRLMSTISRDTLGLFPKEFAILLIISAVLLLPQYKKLCFKKLIIFLLFFCLLVVFVFSVFFPYHIWTHHLLPLYLVIYLIFSLLIFNLFQLKRTFAFILLVIYLCLPKSFNIKSVIFPYNSLVEFDRASSAIIPYVIKSKEYSIFQNSTALSSPILYPVPEMYYFLEIKLKRKLIKIVPRTMFNMNLDKPRRTVFFVCRKYWENYPPFYTDDCYKRIKQSFADYTNVNRIYGTNNVIVFLLTK